MFVAVLERQLGDPRLIEFAQPFRNHRVVLLFGRARERQLEPKFASQIERDPAVFGGVRGREKAAVLAVLHVFAVRLQNARGRAGLQKKLRATWSDQAQRVAQAKTFGKAGGVDVHYHVDQRLYLGRFARFADVTNGCTEFFQNRLRGTKGFLVTAAH